MVQYSIGIDKTVQYSNSAVDSTFVHYYHINFVVNSHV